MLKRIGACLLLVLVVIVGLALTKPSTYEVERSATVAAAPEKIVPLVADFHHWDEWSPWAKLDPNMKVTYGGPQSGPGATYDWTGNSKVGTGHMEVLSVDPAKTSVKLDFLKPFESHTTTDFLLVPTASGTQVTWKMQGPATFMTKLMMVFTSMDKMVGPDFEHGLANLKSAAEK